MPEAPQRAAPRLLGPNWFTPVMGTGILATAASTLPLRPSWLAPVASGLWVLAAVVLLAVVVVTTAQHLQWRGVLRHFLDDPVLVHSYGAVPMALLTVGGGAVAVGTPLVGTTVALTLGASLMAVGTVLGAVTAIGVPRLVRARGGYDVEDADATWLLPVVPPLVSAAVVPLLSPYLPAGWPRLLLLGVCTVLLLVGVLAASAMLVPVALRLRRLGRAPAEDLPPAWVLIGLLGQAVTAVHTIGDGAVTELGDGWAWLGPAFGLPVIGVALLVLVALASWTLRARLRPEGLPFAMTWWSFVFPTGTVVTGLSALSTATGLLLAAELASGLYAALVAVWLLVAALTVRGLLDRSLVARVEPGAVTAR
ncbi:C4-dicarboxylate ABC transporter [Nocardioides sp. AX2bis]|uniref:SLAC1 family transporter n=1 Tax=Nocardioides sp. AX2bis TaxID=2653157 RepID=UPI0012F16DC2|nr:C4-dicarboxylate ABC transporter [Nocardioides sp. AX2bis]VXC13199.1 C4-dicarboxylate transporter/malic acid transport protein [Nocardioides sp. AX2bis]